MAPHDRAGVTPAHGAGTNDHDHCFDCRAGVAVGPRDCGRRRPSQVGGPALFLAAWHGALLCFGFPVVTAPSSRRRPTPRKDAQRYTATGLLMLACVSWGLSTALTKIALEQLTPVDLFGLEIVVSAVPLALLAVARGARPGRPSPAVLLLGVLEPGLAYLLFDLGVRRTDASHAALLLALDTPVTLVLAVAFLRERVNLSLLMSLALSVGGSVLVTWRADGADSSLTGDVLVIASACTAAAFAVLARHVAATREPVVLTAVQMLGALLIAVPIFVTSFARGDSRVGGADGSHVAVAIAVGLLGGVFPFLLFNRAITQLTASRAGLIGVLVPVLGAGASALILDERITRLAAFGGVLAVAGVALAARREGNPPSENGETGMPPILAHPANPEAPDGPAARTARGVMT